MLSLSTADSAWRVEKTDEYFTSISTKSPPDSLGATLVRMMGKTEKGSDTFNTLDAVITELERSYSIKKRTHKPSEAAKEEKTSAKRTMERRKGKGKKKADFA